MRQFTIVLTREPDDGRWAVSVPALPGCYTFGETREHALDMARDAIELFVEQLAADGESIPDDVPTEMAIVAVAVPAVAASG